MKTNLREINIQNLLKSIDKEQKNGILYVKLPKNSIFNKDLLSESNTRSKKLGEEELFSSETDILGLAFFAGKITYTFTNEQCKMARLKDYFAYYQLETNIEQYFTENQDRNTVETAEYNCLIWLLQRRYLEPSQLKSIVRRLTEETIFSILLCDRAIFCFQVDNRQYPLPTASTTREIVYGLERELKQWHKFAPYILQPYQKIQIEKHDALKSAVSFKTYQCLTTWADEQKSLLQLSRQLNCSLVYIAKALYPYVKKGLAILKTNN